MGEVLAPRKNAENTRGKPFEHGNPGRRRGSRNKTTLAVEALLEGEAEALTRKVIELAIAGDTTAMKICFDRIAPPRRERLIEIDLPPIADSFNLSDCVSAVIEAASQGQIGLADANTFINMLMTRDELERRKWNSPESRRPRDMTHQERREELVKLLKNAEEKWKQRNPHRNQLG